MSENKLSRRDMLKIMAAGGAAAAAGGFMPAQTSVTSTAAQEAVTISMMLPQSERPAIMDEVIAEAESRMAAEGLNIKLDITFVPWGQDLSKLTLALAAGEPVDLVFDAPWLAINQNIAQDFYIQLDDPDGPYGNLLEEHGPNILAARPDLMWEANKFFGSVMAIPLGAYHYQGRSYLIRKDIREAVGIDPIQTPEDLEAFLYAVKEQRDDVIPMNAAAVTHYMYHDFDTSVRGLAAPDIDVHYFRGNDGVVRDMFADPDPKVWENFERGVKWFTDGLVPQEIPQSNQTYAIDSGRVAAASTNDFGWNAVVAQNVANLGGELEWVTFFDQSKKRIVNFLQYNFICLAHSSPHPVEAIQFLNWANVKENYDLLTYGFEGRNYEAVGDDQFRPLEELYPWFPFAWIWSPTNHRENANAAPGAVEWNQWSANAENFEADALLGLTLDNEPVFNERSQLQQLKDQYWVSLDSGVVGDLESWWSEYEAQAADAAARVTEEFQRQVDEFKASM